MHVFMLRHALTCLLLTFMPSLHRPPNITRQSCLCRIRWCELSLETVWRSLNVAWHLHVAKKFRPSRMQQSLHLHRVCIFAWHTTSLLVVVLVARPSWPCIAAAAVSKALPAWPPPPWLIHCDVDPTQNAPVLWSGRLNSHRHTRHDKTVLSVSCLAWRCELNNCYQRVQTSHFLSATVFSCRESNSHYRGRHDADRIVLLGLARWCELGISFDNYFEFLSLALHIAAVNHRMSN